MKENLARVLKAICDEYGYRYCVVALSSGEQVTTAGSVSSLRWRGLVDSLFGHTDAIRQLNESLKDQILPQIYGQGEVFCVVMKPLEDLLVGLFGQGDHDPARLHAEATKLSRAIANEVRRQDP